MNLPINQIIMLNKKGWTQAKIANHFGVHQCTIHYLCKRKSVVLQKNYSKGENHYLYNGYRTHDARGCPVVRVDGKPIREHRIIAEQILGRKPLPKELVHHKNEDVTDNRPENIQIVSRSQHRKLHPDIGKKTRFGSKNDPRRI